MIEVERYVPSVLCYRHNMLPEGMGDPRLIKYVRVLIPKIANDNVGAKYQAENILNDD